MKKHLISSLLWGLSFVLTVASTHSTHAAHPLDGSAVPLDTLTASVDLPQSTKPKAYAGVIVWMTSDSTLDLVLDIESVSFGGDCGGLDSIPLHDIYSELSREAVELCLNGPYSALAQNGSVRVLTQGWGERMGSGAFTYFMDCNSLTLGVRTFSCLLDNGVWSYGLISASVGDCLTCGSTCEPTCDYISVN